MRKCTEKEATDIVTIHYDGELEIVDIETTMPYTEIENQQITKIAEKNWNKIKKECEDFLEETANIGFVTFYITT